MLEPPEVLPPPEVFAHVLAGLTLILIVARLVGDVFVRMRQPRVVGEIVAGILIGPTVLGGHLASAPLPDKPAVDGEGLVNALFPLQSFAFLNLVGLVGLVFFMFLVGLELDQRLLKGKGGQMMVMALAVVVVPVALGFAAGSVMGGETWRPAGVTTTTFSLLLSAGLSVTAFPVMARILQEKGLIASPMGAIGVGSAAIVTVLMFLVIAAASASAQGSGVVDAVGLKLLLTLGLTFLLFAIGRPLMALLTRKFQPGGDVDGLLGVMLPLALAVGLAADRIGVNALVGGFLFGLIVPSDRGLGEAMIARMQTAVVLFFLPVFLAVSGLRTDLRLLTPSLIPGLLLFLALMIVGKWGVGYLAGRAVGLGGPEANTVAVLLNCRGLLILVVGLIGLQLGVITLATQAVFVVGAIVTTLMTGPLVDRFTGGRPIAVTADRRTSGVAILTS